MRYAPGSLDFAAAERRPVTPPRSSGRFHFPTRGYAEEHHVFPEPTERPMTSTAAPFRPGDATPTSSIRTRFPALRREHQGKSAAYFDGPGGTQVPESVARAVADYLIHHNANTHWHYPTSEETDRLLVGAREALADFLGAGPAEI